VIHFELDFKH